jgi:hypothetical protein
VGELRNVPAQIENQDDDADEDEGDGPRID